VKIKGMNALIISEGWPTSLYSCSWLDVGGEILVYASVEAYQWRMLKKLEGKAFRLLDDRKVALQLINTHDFLTVLQGSVAFVELSLRDSGSYVLKRGIAIVPYCRFRKGELKHSGLKWQKITHRNLGGVSTMAYSVGVPEILYEPSLGEASLSWGLNRTLKHIVKDGHSGRIMQPPTKSKLESLIPLQAIFSTQYALPCYKSSTGWVSRPLVFEEIGLVYDINELIIYQMAKLDADRLCFRGCIPGKLTQLGDMIIQRLWGHSNSMRKVETNKEPLEMVSADAVKAVGNLLVDPVELLATDAMVNRRKLLEPFLQREENYLIEYGQKAAKSDNAIIPIELWDRAVLRDRFPWLRYSERVATAMNTLRQKFAWRIYIVNLTNSFFDYLTQEYGALWPMVARGKCRKRCSSGTLIANDTRAELLKDLRVGIDALIRALGSDWWNWSKGSTCFFWRWCPSIRSNIRDGFPVYVTSKLPEFLKRQRFTGTKEQTDLLKGKVNKVIARGYVEKGFVKSLINYFSVPKGLDDIRVVYDGTKSGLTDSTWSPNFFMPSISSLLLYSSPSTWYSDMDLGEMFLNFFMHEKLRPFSGVDVTNLLGKGWMRWNRTFMGFRASPYLAVKTYSFVLDIIRGDWKDESNPFAFTHIRINLPGTKGYDPSIPWIAKMWNDEEGAEVVVYMDDIRPFGGSEWRCRAGGKRASKYTQYLGIQDAARKYRPPSQRPGPWCGAFVASVNGSVWAYVSEEKWQKAQRYVGSWIEELKWARENNEIAKLDFKHLEKGRGFLVYLSRTYESITPYLKGIHLTIDSWRDGRDKEGWKEKKKPAKVTVPAAIDDDDLSGDFCEFYDDKEEVGHRMQSERADAPAKVTAVPRLHSDLEVLYDFFSKEKAPWRFVRGKEICVVHYGFGDASGSGFGSTFQTEEGILYRFGTWDADTGGESSNFRELSNLVSSIEERVEQQKSALRGMEVFLFTDNSVAEGAFYKGTSSSKKLFNLVRRLRHLEMFGGCAIHIVHIAGSRMISQGTDGLSRGDVNEGVMQGRQMLSFVPLNQSCLDRSATIKGWIKSWLNSYADADGNRLDFLTIEDWFHKGHDIEGGYLNQDNIWMPRYEVGVKVWSPPPALGQAAVEQLRQARLKRMVSTHVLLIPRIYTSRWRKQLHRAADLVFELPFVKDVWTQEEMHEPLTIAFFFPYLSFKPWQLKRSFAFLGLGRTVRNLWAETALSTGFVLQQLCAWARSLRTLPDGVVRQMLQSPRTFRFLCTQTRK